MIYIVEDDASIRGLEEYALQNSGYIVKGFDNVKQFIFFKVEIHKIHLCFFRKLNRLKIDFVKVLYVYYTTFLK